MSNNLDWLDWVDKSNLKYVGNDIKKIIRKQRQEEIQKIVDKEKEERRKIFKKYYENNKEKIKEQQKKYKENNKEKIKEYQKKYIEKNKEKLSQKIYCDVCDCWIRRDSKSRHLKSKKHLRNLDKK